MDNIVDMIQDVELHPKTLNNFNRLSWTLHIDAEEKPCGVDSTYLLISKIDAWRPIQVYDKTVGDLPDDPSPFTDATSTDLALPGLMGYTITLNNGHETAGKYRVSTKHVQRTFTNKRGYFTCGELIDHIVEFENTSRIFTNWFGNIDEHHVFFEGLEPKGNNTYTVNWGS